MGRTDGQSYINVSVDQTCDCRVCIEMAIHLVYTYTCILFSSKSIYNHEHIHTLHNLSSIMLFPFLYARYSQPTYTFTNTYTHFNLSSIMLFPFLYARYSQPTYTFTNTYTHFIISPAYSLSFLYARYSQPTYTVGRAVPEKQG